MTRPLEGQHVKNVNRRIFDLRKKAGLSREELSKMTNISPSHIKNLENGHTNMSTDSLYRLALALKCTSDYLLGLDDNPEPNWKDYHT